MQKDRNKYNIKDAALDNFLDQLLKQIKNMSGNQDGTTAGDRKTQDETSFRNTEADLNSLKGREKDIVENMDPHKDDGFFKAV